MEVLTTDKKYCSQVQHLTIIKVFKVAILGTFGLALKDRIITPQIILQTMVEELFGRIHEISHLYQVATTRLPFGQAMQITAMK